MMALHRGRIDLLEAHLRQDPGLLARTFRFDEIFPRELGCQDESFPRTPLDGATLLHVAVEMDELDIARWLLDRGMAVDAPTATDADGFGGHTALFSAVVSYPNFWMNYPGGWAHSRKPQDSPFARLLLERGADPNARASLRERVTPDASVSLREHRDLTPIAWGRRFHNPIVVSRPAMQLIADHGGHE
jgi:ankyrin repeat protein